MAFQRYEVGCPGGEEYGQAEALSRARKSTTSPAGDRPCDDAETYLIRALGKPAFSPGYPDYSCSSATVLAVEEVRISKPIIVDAIGGPVARKGDAAFWRLMGTLGGVARMIRIVPPRGHLASLYFPRASGVPVPIQKEAHHQPSRGRPAREDAMRQLAFERAEYERQRGEILAAYEGQYVACIGGKVVDHDADFGALARRAYSRFGAQPMLLTQVTRERTVSRIGSGLAGR